MRTLFIGLLALAIGACATPERALPYYDSADFTPRWEISAASAFHTIRPCSLIDQQNRVVTEQDLHGKIAVVNFFFTSCGSVCPTTIKSMMDIQQQFANADDVILMSHSVTPVRDSVPALQEFAREKHVNAARWKLLTGAEQEIYDLGKNFYFLDDNQGKAENDALFSHTENFVLVDKQRRLRGIYNGMDPSSMQALAKDIELLRRTQ